jgi:hypothetical protein
LVIEDDAGATPDVERHRSTDYAVVGADLHADREAVLELWRGHGNASPEAKYQWFYLDHPEGPPTLLKLTHGPEPALVGVAALGTRRVQVRGEAGSAGILADLLVLPGHRTLYPALLLQKRMQGLARERHRIVYGIPNKNSTPIVRRLGYAKVGELVRYSNVLRFGGYLERLLPPWLGRAAGALADRVIPLYFRPHRLLLKAWDAGWSDGVDARFDDLWERGARFDGIIGARDARFLGWRFLQRPGHVHRIFTLARRGDTRLTAYAVCEADGATLHVRDFLADPACHDHVRLALHLLSRQAYREGFSNLSMEFLGPPRLQRLLVGAGMVERGQRALYASFAPGDEDRLRSLDWYMTSADEDQ